MPKFKVGSTVRRKERFSLRNTVGTVIEMRDDIKSVVVQWSNMEGTPQTLHKTKLTVVNGNKPLTPKERSASCRARRKQSQEKEVVCGNNPLTPKRKKQSQEKEIVGGNIPLTPKPRGPGLSTGNRSYATSGISGLQSYQTHHLDD